MYMVLIMFYPASSSAYLCIIDSILCFCIMAKKLMKKKADAQSVSIILEYNNILLIVFIIENEFNMAYKFNIILN